MDSARALRLGSYVLAAAVLLPIVLSAPEFLFRPANLVHAPLFRALESRVSSGWLYWLLFAGLPLLVIVRAVATETAADIVLATLAIPCFLLVASSFGSIGWGGYWRSALAQIGGTALAFIVFADALAAWAASVRSKPS